jgi:hypothetical protein
LVAASVIGLGRSANLPTWNVTDARLEQQLALFNNSLFPIDDLTTIGGKAREAYQRVRDLAYRLHQGWARGRHSAFSIANSSVREQWRAIGLTSAEISIRDLAQAAGCERLPGECVRLIDVPVLLNGEDRLFDRHVSQRKRSHAADYCRWRCPTAWSGFPAAHPEHHQGERQTEYERQNQAVRRCCSSQR